MIKFRHLLIISSLILLIIIIVFITYILFFTEIGDRFARYHNYADVVVRINNNQINMKGIKVNHIYETDDVLETDVFF